MARSTASPLSTSEMRKVTALADVDARTVTTYVAGTRATYAATAKAIEKALRKIGRADLVRNSTPAAA